MAIKIIDKTQLNPSSLQKVSGFTSSVLGKGLRCKACFRSSPTDSACKLVAYNYVFESNVDAFGLF